MFKTTAFAADEPGTARAAVLARIRGALAAGPAPAPPEPDWTTPVHPPLPDQPLALTFADSFRRAGGYFYVCDTAAQLGEQLRAYLAEQGIRHFYVWEPAMQALLVAAEVPFVPDETGFLAHAEAGLTSCAALVARTGSVLVSAATAAGRRLSIYPDQHVVLARIRGALAAGPAPAPPEPDWTTPVHPPLPDQPLALTFADSFRRAGGYFYVCDTAAQLGEQLCAYLAEQGIRHFYVWEPAMQALLTAAEVPFLPTETDFLAHADAGLTSCAALVARTGSVLVSAATAAGRRLSIYPDQHVVLARPSQVVAEIGQALARLQADSGNGLPSMASLTTGPSRTADIEKTLVLGAHGPRRLSLFLLSYEL